MLGLGFRTNFLGTRVCACRDNVKVIVDQEVLLERRGFWHHGGVDNRAERSSRELN